MNLSGFVNFLVHEYLDVISNKIGYINHFVQKIELKDQTVVKDKP